MGAHICIAPGSINIDLVLKTSILKGAKTFRGHYSETQGGKGANEAVAIRLASKTERTVYLVGCVGRDEWGNQALEKLRAKGVSTDFIKVVDDYRTGMVMEYLFGDGEVTIGLDLGANDALTLEDIDRARHVIQSARILLSQIEAPIEVVEYSLQLARSHGVFTFLDPSVVPEQGDDRKRLFDRMLPHVDVVAPNRSEALALTGVFIEDEGSALEAADILLREVETVIITLRGEGALVARGKDYHHVAGIKVNSIDGGAAGDTFRGVFCEALLERSEEKGQDVHDADFGDLVKAAEWANYAAALCITRSGAYPSIPTRAEIEEFRKIHEN